MPILFACESMPHYLRFEVSGTRDEGKFGDEMAAIWRRVADECRASRHVRVLGISRLTGAISKAELFRVGQLAPKILHDAGCRRVAYVVLGSPEALQAIKFGEDVAVNRGQVTRVFDDEPSAVTWLLND